MRLKFSLNRILSLSTFILIVIYIVVYFLSCQLLDDAYAVGMSEVNVLSRIRSILALVIVAASLAQFHLTKFKLSRLGRLFLIFSVYLFLHNCYYSFGGIVNAVNLYTSMTLWIYIYLAFYTYSFYNNSLGNPRTLLLLSVLFFLLLLVNYFAGVQIKDTYAYIESYFLITILPLAFLLENRKITSAILILAVVASVLSGKRTGAISCIIVFVIYVMSNHKTIQTRILSILKLIVIVVCCYFLLSLLLETRFDLLIDRMMALSDDGGSGRDQVFALVLNDFGKSDFFQTIFGHGYNSVINSPSSLGYSAHNEFLETLYDYGLIGNLLYISIFIVLWRNYRKIKIKKVKTAYLVSILVFFINSLFSHQILYTTNIIMLCAFWGYCDARLIRN